MNHYLDIMKWEKKILTISRRLTSHDSKVDTEFYSHIYEGLALMHRLGNQIDKQADIIDDLLNKYGSYQTLMKEAEEGEKEVKEGKWVSLKDLVKEILEKGD